MSAAFNVVAVAAAGQRLEYLQTNITGPVSWQPVEVQIVPERCDHYNTVCVRCVDEWLLDNELRVAG
ncbi:hypothetical protein ACIA5D_36695 [Actinoplanes sp. NPDC051513]|uniref:hypothetical protein n=1 Tax=Actinoplanes sp. NPDC051513 TaxID=3363908 RepID=UPI0037BA0E79